MTDNDRCRHPARWRQRIDLPVVTAFGCIIVLLLLGSLYSPNFLSPEYLLQQLKVGAFLGIIATGMMLVILLGQIDLSVPWTVTLGAMMGCAAVCLWARPAKSSPSPSASSAACCIGLVNGIGVAYLRIPSMIITLARQRRGAGADGRLHRRLRAAGCGFPGDALPRRRHSTFGIPHAVIVWVVIGALAVFLLTRTTLRPRRLRHRQQGGGGLSLAACRRSAS